MKRWIKKAWGILLAAELVFAGMPFSVSAGSVAVDGGDKSVYNSTEQLRDMLLGEGISLQQGIKTSVDLSQSGYLPEVKSQIGGSCQAFANVYYQYSFMANQQGGLKGEKAKVYSPYYVYSYMCGPNAGGVYSNASYRYLQARGCLEWEEFYNDNQGSEADCKWGVSDSVGAMRNALNMRLNHFYDYYEEYPIGESYTVEEKIATAKLLLSNGYVLTAGYGSGTVSSSRNDYAGDVVDVVYRMGNKQNSGGHAVTIVGYDDSFSYDVNANGRIDEGERGAFKAVNSWGQYNQSNKGYFWILYDAVVNEKSQITGDGEPLELPYSTVITKGAGREEEYYVRAPSGKETRLTDDNWKTLLTENCYMWPDEQGRPMWEKIANYLKINIKEDDERDIYNLITKKAAEALREYKIKYHCLPSNWDEIITTMEGSRTRMFSGGYKGAPNAYSFITIAPQQVQIVGQVDYVLNNRSDYSLVFEKQQPNGNWKKETPQARNSTTRAVEATEVFDLSSLAETTSNNITPNGKWRATITVGKENDCSSFRFALTDLDGRILAEKQVDQKAVQLLDDGRKRITVEFDVNIRQEDTNYDGYLTEADFDDLLYFMRSQEAKSPLQKKLFDCNKDGTIDSNDAQLMFCTAYQAIYAGDTSFVHMSKDDLYNTLIDFSYTKLGDVNLDGTVNETDFRLIQQMLSGTYGSAFQRLLADVNKDGQLTNADLLQLSRTAAFLDVNHNGKRNEDDIYAVRDHIFGLQQLTSSQQKEADFNGNGKVDEEDWYMLIYSYYLNMDTNPDLGRQKFYSDLLVTLGMQLGDLNGSGGFDEHDLRFLKEALEGSASSYKYLFLADMNKDLKLDEEDLKIFTEEYMSDIPFTYTLDRTAKTMIITGVKDKSIKFADIQPSYCVNRVKYKVKAIGAKAFAGCRCLYTVYIPATVTDIPGAKLTESPFYDTDSNQLKINCEAGSKPSGFGKFWNNYTDTEFGYIMKEAGSLFEYEADSKSQTLTITGLKSDWYGKNSNSAYITVDDRYLVNGQAYTVRRIDDNAFCKRDNAVESVELPATLEEIGYSAFDGMYYLDTVSLARCVNLKKIGSNAFANNGRLEQVWICSSVEIIEADSPEDSIVYGCRIDNIWIIAEASEPKPGWGPYWNYIDENTIAETNYIGTPQSSAALRSQRDMIISLSKLRIAGNKRNI